jgi:hypothetical protein
MSQVEDLGSRRHVQITELDEQSCMILATSVPKAAAMIDVSPRELYSMMKAGRLPYVKHGRRRLLMIDDLRALLLSQRVAA